MRETLVVFAPDIKPGDIIDIGGINYGVLTSDPYTPSPETGTSISMFPLYPNHYPKDYRFKLSFPNVMKVFVSREVTNVHS